MHAPITPPPTPRWFVRCDGCLQVSALDIARPESGTRCTICEGAVRPMGRVHFNRLVVDREACPCDDRCTMAAGPHCDCQCGGKNHGSKMVVTVTRDVGGVPRLTPVNPTQARARHKEWTHATNELQDKIRMVFPHYARWKAGESLGAWETSQAGRAGMYLREAARAGTLKSHHARMKVIKKVDEKVLAIARAEGERARA